MCKWIVAFVFLYLIVIVLFVVLGGLIGGIDWCGRAMSPNGAALPAQVFGLVVMLHCIYPLGHLLAWVSAAPTELLILLFSVSPGFHIGLCPHSTLGYAGVSPLQGSLSDWVVVEVLLKTSGLCHSVTQPTCWMRVSRKRAIGSFRVGNYLNQ